MYIPYYSKYIPQYRPLYVTRILIRHDPNEMNGFIIFIWTTWKLLLIHIRIRMMVKICSMRWAWRDGKKSSRVTRTRVKDKEQPELQVPDRNKFYNRITSSKKSGLLIV